MLWVHEVAGLGGGGRCRQLRRPATKVRGEGGRHRLESEERAGSDGRSRGRGQVAARVRGQGQHRWPKIGGGSQAAWVADVEEAGGPN
jgi:hypothetical protein